MALQSGRLAGLDVPQKSFDLIDKWLDLAQAKDSDHLYVYNPLAPTELQTVKDKNGRDVIDPRTGRPKRVDMSHGRRPNQTMTSVGLLMRMYSGQRRDDPGMIAGARYLMQNLPSVIRITGITPRRSCSIWETSTGRRGTIGCTRC